MHASETFPSQSSSWMAVMRVADSGALVEDDPRRGGDAGALVEEERLLEAGREPARVAVATPGGEPWKRSSLIARESEMDVHVLITALRPKRVVISGP